MLLSLIRSHLLSDCSCNGIAHGNNSGIMTSSSSTTPVHHYIITFDVLTCFFSSSMLSQINITKTYFSTVDRQSQDVHIILKEQKKTQRK